VTPGPWLELVEDARWAPSPHNIQPWRLRSTSESTADIACPPDQLLRATDPESLFTAVGIGCFVESLAVAGAARRLHLDVEATGVEPGAPDPFARLTLVPGAADSLGPDLLHRRKTSRLPYDGSPVEPRLLDELASIAADYGHDWQATSDPETVQWVVELNRDTLFLDMADDATRAEVGRWLRFSEAEATARRDGFSPAALGFPGWLLRLFFERHRLLELPVLEQGAHALYGRTMRGTRTVAWLRGPFSTTTEALTAGRMLMRLWLTMTRDGVHLHPFGSIVTNKVANARLQARLGAGDGTLWLVMRLGRSAEPPRSLRLDVDELLAA
jgi:hypothetical protein